MVRVFDIMFTSIAIIILSPIFLVIIAVLSVTGEREIFYRQPRVGKGGRIFGVFKFVTMVKNSASIGTGYLTTKNDPRVLPIGKILRKTKLNEFPQLFNILIGDMSIVGPRPQVPEHFEIYPEHVKKEIKKIRPGLTGIGSIFFRDEESILEKNKHLSYEECYKNIIAPYKGELELWYLRHQSIGLYFTLVMLTAWVVIFPESRLHLRLFKSLPKPPGSLVF